MAARLVRENLGRVYTAEKDIPFVSDGRQALIGDSVERVRRDSGLGNGVFARKTVSIDEQRKELLEDAKRKLLQEARVLRYAQHRHVVELVDAYFLEYEQGTLFSIVMERADSNLNVYLKRRTSDKNIDQLAGWFGCLISAVASIHDKGIRHRDIKPSNILVMGKRVLLADFGISKMGIGRTMPTTVPELARSRARDYCAPEIEHGSTRGRSADIFSLGAVFLEMLIAHSYFTERQNLDDTLTSPGYRSYALSVDKVHQFMDRIERELRPTQWFLKVLSCCRKMLYSDRDRRPLATELRSAWLSLQPSDSPLALCTCSENAELSEECKLVRLCSTGSPEELGHYLSNERNLNIPGAIHQVSARGLGGLVQNFLHRSVDVNIRDNSGQTALHCAAAYGHMDIVRALLDSGADPLVKDEEGSTALQCAAGQGHLRVVEHLLRKGADVRATDAENRTALQFAARRGHTDVVKALLNGGADAAATDAKGRTALHFAAGCRSEAVVEMLLTVLGGKVVTLKDVNGQTALDFAARGTRAANYEAIANLLKKRMATAM